MRMHQEVSADGMQSIRFDPPIVLRNGRQDIAIEILHGVDLHSAMRFVLQHGIIAAPSAPNLKPGTE